MKFIQRILSHSLLIAVIVIAFLAWFYRAELLPETFGPQTKVAEEKAEFPAAAPEPTPDTAVEKATSPVSAAPVNPDMPPMADPHPEVSTSESDMYANTNDLPPLAPAPPVVTDVATAAEKH